jgi:predicted unusual protein kinase regulating ubiquinone biosynthesis (AarF/ABC1/UbiB family)
LQADPLAGALGDGKPPGGADYDHFAGAAPPPQSRTRWLASWAGALGGAAALVGGARALARREAVKRVLIFWRALLPIYLHYRLRWIYGTHAEKWTRAQREVALKPLHDKYAPRVFEAAMALGGMYVKIGQLMSMMRGVLPRQYTRALMPLQNGVTPKGIDEVAALVEAELGAPISEVYASFDPTPIGAASIAQVS